MKSLKSLFFLPLLLLLVLPSCKDEEQADDGCSLVASFDQSALFTNLADNIIIPSYQELNEKVNRLVTETDAFIANSNDNQLTLLQETWLEAYLVWQACAQYEFGPAEEVFLRSSVNNFPANEGDIELNISSGSYDFDKPDNFDKGFPALDYLLFGIKDSKAEIIDFYSTDADAAKYKSYLVDVVKDIQTRVKKTYDAWNNGYKNTFVQNTGTAAGTSLSLIINNLNQNYEFIKREKIGTPLGIVLDIPNPKVVEAYHSKNSLVLAKAALEASQNLYLGNNGLGLDDMLDAANIQKGSQSLNQVIKERFTQAIASVVGLENEGPLDELIVSERDAVRTAYNEITKQLVPLKTDMPSSLCVSITYIDNPSDTD